MLLVVYTLIFSPVSADYAWKNRVVRCAPMSHEAQADIFKKDPALVKDLKLVLLSDMSITKGCKLYGLDTGEKFTTNSIFQLDQLEQIINSMPMRQRELKTRKKSVIEEKL